MYFNKKSNWPYMNKFDPGWFVGEMRLKISSYPTIFQHISNVTPHSFLRKLFFFLFLLSNLLALRWVIRPIDVLKYSHDCRIFDAIKVIRFMYGEIVIVHCSFMCVIRFHVFLLHFFLLEKHKKQHVFAIPLIFIKFNDNDDC